MTKQQLRKLQWLTNLIERRHHDGRMSYQIEPATADGRIVFLASNVNDDLRWFESVERFIASIGPRGGLHVNAEPWYNTISI